MRLEPLASTLLTILLFPIIVLIVAVLGVLALIGFCWDIASGNNP